MTNEERETHLSMTADDRSIWIVFSDDPVMMRRLDAIAEFVRNVGEGKEYRLRADQLTLRRGKRQLSEAQRAKLAKRLAAMRNPL